MSRTELHRSKKVSMSFIMLGLFLSFLLISVSIYLLLFPFPSKEQVDYFRKSHPIIFQGNIYPDEGIVKNKSIYLPITFIKEFIDPSIIFDEQSNSIIITTKDKVVQIPNEKLTYFLNEEPFQLQFEALITENDNVYLTLDQLKPIYPIKLTSNAETGAIFVQKHGEIMLPATVEGNLNEHEQRLRISPSITSPYVTEVMKGEQIFVEGDRNNYYKVRKSNGIAGYIPKKAVSLQAPTEIIVRAEDKVLPLPRLDLSWPINLTWEAVYSKNPNTASLPKMPGVNVVSPTWFELKNGKGDVNSLASQDYVNWAKKRGYQVWGLFSNGFDPELTHKAFKHYQTRAKIIRQLLSYATIHKLDGINIDIENVNYEDRELVTQFVRELTPYMHQAGLIVSMDVTFISNNENWSKFYEREKLAKVVDFIMVMAYDEHWATSPVSGSVASLPWVEKNLKRLLEVVPNEKILLGIPLYTRIWKEQQTESGNIEVSSKAYSMDYIQQWINERNLTPQYDPTTGQNFVQYKDNDTTYKVWIEDETSLQKRVDLVHHYQLAGIATWSRFFANDQAWIAMNKGLHQMISTPLKKNE